MLFASSHDALKQKLDGIALEVQATDHSEISYAIGLSLLPGDTVISSFLIGSARQSVDIHSLIFMLLLFETFLPLYRLLVP